MAVPETMSPDQTAVLAEFARTVKAAARSVSLYPATHPSIQASLRRVVAASARLTAAGDVTLSVLPDQIAIDGRTPARPDLAVGELAALLHERLVGALRVSPAAAPGEWHALLLLLSRAPEELFADGGIGRAWAMSGHGHFAIREIDYAEVLRERAGGGDAAAWDRIIAFCLHGDAGSMDDSSLSALLGTAGDPARFGALLARLDGASQGVTVGARAGAWLRLLHTVAGALGERAPADVDAVLQTAAEAAARLTPEMLLALLARARQGSPAEGALVDGVVDQMGDGSIVAFVAGSVIAEQGATERLAQAFEVLVPDPDRKARLIDSARADVESSPLGQEACFDQLWQSAASMLTSYSDRNYVSAEYGRELTASRTQAMEIERVSDDPPDRVQAWLSTVSDAAVAALDHALLLDLLRIEQDPEPWHAVAAMVTGEIERRTLVGDSRQAEPLLDALVRERGDEGRAPLRPAAAAALEALATGPLVRHVVLLLRKADDEEVEPLGLLCRAIGPAIVRPLAEALAVEENSRAIRRLREMLLGFGAAGRHSVEQLKHSSNSAVRRTAIDLLRVFGGQEALPELASMLGDADPQVQRESIRAIVQIATAKAYAVLERHLVAGSASRATILQQLIGLRDDKAIPLFSHVLRHTSPRGRLVQMHAEIIEALGGLSGHPESARTLRGLLHGGQWWAPGRTATLRQAAAAALRRIGTADTLAVLEEAAAHGSRGVRNAARPYAGATPRRERSGS